MWVSSPGKDVKLQVMCVQRRRGSRVVGGLVSMRERQGWVPIYTDVPVCTHQPRVDSKVPWVTMFRCGVCVEDGDLEDVDS